MLEVIELGEEGSKLLIIGVLLQRMMKKTHTQYELRCVFGRYSLFLFCFLCYSGDVMMTTEIEIHYFLNLTVNHFGHVDMVRAFFFIAIHNCYNIYNSLFIYKNTTYRPKFDDLHVKIF